MCIVKENTNKHKWLSTFPHTFRFHLSAPTHTPLTSNAFQQKSRFSAFRSSPTKYLPIFLQLVFTFKNTTTTKTIKNLLHILHSISIADLQTKALNMSAHTLQMCNSNNNNSVCLHSNHNCREIFPMAVANDQLKACCRIWVTLVLTRIIGGYVTFICIGCCRSVRIYMQTNRDAHAYSGT